MHNRASDQGVSDHNSREQQYAQQAITTGLGALTATDAVTADLCDTGVIVAARKVVAPAHPGAVAGTTVKRGPVALSESRTVMVALPPVKPLTVSVEPTKLADANAWLLLTGVL